MKDQYHSLSLLVYAILDWIGASEEMRDKYREAAIVWEIIATMENNLFKTGYRSSFFIFGSSCEGTTTIGLESDTDVLQCHGIPVVESISEAAQHGISFLMVTDETTKPGYFKLQFVWNTVPLYGSYTFNHKIMVTDTNDRNCLRNDKQVDFIDHIINGPAVTRTSENGGTDVDLVKAVRCQHIPRFAQFWLRRVIRCNRLNDTQLHMLKRSGCFFVGKNHPLSDNDRIEWKLSFSFQERELMASLNSTQHKCYILLKIIKKDIIQKRVPGSISSYHCKTCVLYAVESTPPEFWTRRNLLKCTLLCTKLLLRWVKEQYCPNYFIPNENMFDSLDRNTLQQVHVVLEDMIEQGCSFVWSLKCDDIGNILYDVLFGCGPSIMRLKHINVSEQVLLKYIQIYGSLSLFISDSLNKCNSNSALQLLSELHSMQTYFLNTDCLEYHTEKETRRAISYFIPHIRLQITQCVASIMLTTSDADLLKMLFDTFKYYFKESKDCDAISKYLIVASYYLQSNRYDPCEDILLQCERSLKSFVVSVCGCEGETLYPNEATNELVRMFGSQDIPYTEFARTCTTGCLIFHPHLANLVPSALHYEMYRSVNTPPGSSNKSQDFRLDLSAVDSKVYLYFLQYVLYSKTNKPVYKEDAINNLIHVITTDSNLGHKDTDLNLLGWIFNQEHMKQRAMTCFLESWRIRPNHNAAIWHALILIHSTNSHAV